MLHSNACEIIIAPVPCSFNGCTFNIYGDFFVFQAAWKVIQSWLRPESREKIQFCDRNSIDRFIDLSNVPLHMGGTSDYVFNYQITGIANPDNTDDNNAITTQQPNTIDNSLD